MAEGYSSRAPSRSVSLPLNYFLNVSYCGKKSSFNESDMENFYTLKFRTVLLCQLTLTKRDYNDIPPIHFITTSSMDRELHAEQKFIDEAKDLINQYYNEQWDEISIVMLISRSPCMKCREELEDFLSSFLTDFLRGTKPTFILRISSLYREGEIKKEDKPTAEMKLANWKQELEMQGIGFYLEGICVVEELPGEKWADYTDKRGKKDFHIKQHVESIERGTERFKQLIRSIDCVERLLGADSQLVLGELIISAYRYDKTRVSATRIKLSKKNTICTEKEIIQEANSKLPRCWEYTMKTLLLVSSYAPCIDCQRTITEFMIDRRREGTANKLILYLFHPYPMGTPADVKETEKQQFFEWIRSLETQSVLVQ